MKSLIVTLVNWLTPSKPPPIHAIHTSNKYFLHLMELGDIKSISDKHDIMICRSKKDNNEIMMYLDEKGGRFKQR